MNAHSTLPPAAQEMLQGCASLSLAFADAAGPWAAPLYFVSDHAQDLYFTSSANSRHGRLPDGHAVAATIAPEATGWRAIRGIQCSGVQKRVASADRGRVSALYLAKFPELAGILTAPSGAAEERLAAAFTCNPLYVFQTRVLRIIDNGAGLALRDTFVRDDAGNWARESETSSLKKEIDRA